MLRKPSPKCGGWEASDVAILAKKVTEAMFNLSPAAKAQVEELEAKIDRTIIDNFDGIAVVVKINMPPLCVGVLVKRYYEAGWAVSVVAERERGSKITGETITMTFSPRYA